jgi:hypothetical protein
VLRRHPRCSCIAWSNGARDVVPAKSLLLRKAPGTLSTTLNSYSQALPFPISPCALSFSFYLAQLHTACQEQQRMNAPHLDACRCKHSCCQVSVRLGVVPRIKACTAVNDHTGHNTAQDVGNATDQHLAA